MIELNIIKGRLEKFRKKKMVFNVFVIYLAGLLFLLLILSMNLLANKASILRIKKEIKTIEDKIAAEQEKFNYIKEREKKTQELLKSINFFTEVARERVLWSPVLAFTGEKVPPGIWLDRFTVKDTSDKQKKGVITVLISGYVLPGMVNEREAIDRFVRSLSDGNIFTDVFLKEVRKTTQDEIEVLAFQMECVLKQKRGADNVSEVSD
ncbi:MAG TPA: PilN domain-containing protein [bacterium]|nr:PilN domain-containing protein [bacterium]HPP30184.1 PilN domain-containing protein [bacterium]